MRLPDILRKRLFIFIVLLVAVLGSVLVSFLAYRLIVPPQSEVAAPSAAPTAQRPTPTATPLLLPPENPSKVLGIEGDPAISFPGIYWVRIPYPSCGTGNLYGDVLKNTIQKYHQQGIRVLLTLCQGPNNDQLYDSQPFTDAAQSTADAVQCGNEEMKQDSSVAFLYIPPEKFAKFYALCEQAVHAVRPDVPALLGSLDPHVGGIDYQPLVAQVQYLNKMQTAMNTIVHPGGHWDWHTQTLGLIDSWHNGYPDSSVNSLYGLLSFWAQQFRVNLASGQLGKHIWVVEGTGCFKGCGLDPSPASLAIAHILSLITDVQTTMKYQVPFFYFSGKDFDSVGYHWPIGVLDIRGHPKPIRQDLAMGARKLALSCPNGSVAVADQEQLLAKMYNGCTLSGSYLDTIMG